MDMPVAMGNTSIASGYASVAIGNATTASGGFNSIWKSNNC